MKKVTLIIVLIFLGLQLSAQSDFLEKKPISISLLDHDFTHFGLKVGTQWDFREWEKEKEKKNGPITKKKGFFVSPEFGAYTHIQNHTGLLLNVDFGYKIMRLKGEKGIFFAYSVGLGLLNQFNSGTTYIYENGALTESSFASRSYIMPSLSVEFGRQFNSKMAFFTKLTIGSKLFYNTGFSAELFNEFGMKFNLGKF